MKKTIALLLALVMVFALAGTSAFAAPVEVTIFNSKMEIQSQLEELANQWNADHDDVNITVYYSSDTVAAHMASRYAAKNPYVISMVDAKDIYSLGPEHALDMSDQDWVKDTTQAITVDGKVLGFPVCVEARGILYNADAIEAATGEAFDPAAIKTTEDFQALIDALIAGGMATPCGLQKEDWSLAAHFFASVYEMHDDPDAFIAGIKDGSVNLADDAVFNALMDTFDVMKANNWMKDAPLSAVREDTEMYLALGEIAFKYGGNWDWSDIKEFEPDANLGMMPVPSALEGYNDKLVGGGSKYFFIDNSVSEEQQQAAKDFINWFAMDAEGQDFVSNTCALVSPYKSNTLDVSDPLSVSVKAYADAGNLIPNYNFFPDDHITKAGASMQKYLGGEIDRQGLADELTEYWKGATPIEHCDCE